MKNEKLTVRQQIKDWVLYDNLLEDNDKETLIDDIFRKTMIYKLDHQDISLRQAYIDIRQSEYHK